MGEYDRLSDVLHKEASILRAIGKQYPGKYEDCLDEIAGKILEAIGDGEGLREPEEVCTATT